MQLQRLIQERQKYNQGDKIETDQGTFFIELCLCGDNVVVPNGSCNVHCMNCGRKVDCS